MSGFAVNAQKLAINQDLIDGAAVQNDFPNVFRPIGNIFKRLFGKKPRVIYEYYANVNNLTLSRNEVIASCATGKDFCSGSKGIGIYTQATDHEGDPLIYVYSVSGGKIIGQGDKVVWDLAGEKPGTYTITAGVDDSCGVCGRTMTKTATVVECNGCK